MYLINKYTHVPFWNINGFYTERVEEIVECRFLKEIPYDFYDDFLMMKRSSA